MKRFGSANLLLVELCDVMQDRFPIKTSIREGRIVCMNIRAQNIGLFKDKKGQKGMG